MEVGEGCGRGDGGRGGAVGRSFRWGGGKEVGLWRVLGG